jgi:purine-binding chemotaxis protein CheW
VKYATFFIAGHLFGIPIYLVQEIARPLPLHPIAGHDPRIAGLINLRGRTAVALDMQHCICAQPPDPTLPPQRTKHIILETTDGLPQEALAMGLRCFEEPLVLVVDEMYKITAGEKEQYFTTPAHVNELYVDGVMKLEQRLLTLISIPRLLDTILAHPEGGR